MPSTETSYPRFRLASDHSLLVTFGGEISRSHHSNVARFFKLLRDEPNAATRNIHPAYCSVLVSFDPLKTHPKDFDLYVRGLVDRIESVAMPTPRSVELPVCYDDEFSPDLGFVANHNRLTKEQAIHCHTSVEYLVYFLGFSPGFPYMGELPQQLATPRLATPRLRVPEGSVAIGGIQTGIYPIASPGGWRIIGRTPVRLFEPLNNPPTFLEMGDLVRFRSIPVQEFLEIQNGGSAFLNIRRSR